MAGELFHSILSTPARLFRSASGRSPQTLSDPDNSSPSVARHLFETPSSFTFTPAELSSMRPKDRLALGRLLRSPLPIKYSGQLRDRHVFQHLVVTRAHEAGWQRFTTLSLPGLGSIDVLKVHQVSALAVRDASVSFTEACSSDDLSAFVQFNSDLNALLLSSLSSDYASRAVPYRCSKFALVFYVNLMQLGSTLPSADVTYNIQHQLLTTTIPAPDYNVKAWADKLGGLLIDLHATGSTLPDNTYFASVCFKALLAVPIFSFQTRIHQLQHEWDSAHATHGDFLRFDHVLDNASTIYDSMLLDNLWRPNDSVGFLATPSASSLVTSTTSPFKQSSSFSTPIYPAWRYNNPSNLPTLTRNNQTFHWCTFHRMWHKHTSADCYKNPSNSSAPPSAPFAAPSSSASHQTVARLAVSHNLLYASDDEDISNDEDPFLYSLDISDVANDESL